MSQCYARIKWLALGCNLRLECSLYIVRKAIHHTQHCLCQVLRPRGSIHLMVKLG